MSRGEEYIFLTPFDLILPTDQDRATPSSRIRLSNVDRRLTTLLRSTSTPAQFLIEIVLAASPDDVEVTFPLLDLMQADTNAAEIELTVTLETLASEPYPSGTFAPSGFAGLFS